MTRRASWDGEGVAVVYKECPKCGHKNAPGTYFKRAADGRHMFTCDICGQTRSEGWSINSHEIMVQKKEEYQHAFDNRDRWRRENTEKYNQLWDEATERLETPPDGVRNLIETLRSPFDTGPLNGDTAG